MRIRLIIIATLSLIYPVMASAQGFPSGWTTLSNTALTGVIPANNFCGDGFQFQSNAQFLFDQWSGGAADTTNNRLLIWGGGHGNGYDNSVYALKLNANGTASVQRLMGPTCPTNFGPQANTDTLAGGTVPNAFQTYGCPVYLPSRNSLLNCGGVPARPSGNFDGLIAEASLTPLTWALRGSWSFNGSAGMLAGAYFQATGHVIFFSQYDLVDYNPTTFAKTTLTSSQFAAGSHGYAAIDQVNHNLVYLDQGAFSWYNLDGPSYTVHNSSGTCSGVSDAYPGLTWNSDLGKLVAYPWGGTSIYVVTFSGGNYSCAAQSFSGPAPTAITPQYQGTFGRFQYFPNLQVYAVCLNATANCSVLNTVGAVNPFSTRSVGVNVPGGAASIVSNQPFNSGSLPTCSPAPCFTGVGPQINIHVNKTGTPVIDTTTFPPNDGASSAKFTVAPGDTTASAGTLSYNFRVPGDAAGLFGAGQEFYIQYKQRMGAALLVPGNITANDGVKLDITTEGDAPTLYASDCDNHPGEIVSQTDPTASGRDQTTSIPWMYINCGFSGGANLFVRSGYDPVALSGAANNNSLDQDAAGCPHYHDPAHDMSIPITEPSCWNFVGDEWFTVQKHIKIGTFGDNTTSLVEQWFAHANSPSVLTTNGSDLAIPNTGTGVTNKYGKIVIGIYGTGVTYNVNASVWYDSIIISLRRIPDPDVANPNAPDSMSMALGTGTITVSWRVNSQNGTGQDDTGFLVERCTGTRQACFSNPQSGFSQIGTTAAGASSYQDNSVTNGTTYTYRVRAKNGAGNSAYAVAICFNGGTTCGGTAIASGSGGASPAVSLSPVSPSFGNQLLQTTSSEQNITLTNTGTAALTITGIALTGTNPSEYAISSNPCGASLGAGLSCVVGVTFTPTILGARSANLTFTTNAASSPDNAALSGTGTATVFGIGNINIQGNVTIKP